MRPGGGLGVVLHREAEDPSGLVAQLQTLDDVVVETHVADPGEAVGRTRLALERRVDGEAVVVSGDLDPPRGQVHHRLVEAAVPVRQFVGAEAQGPAEQLVAEADAEERDTGRQRRLDQVDRPVGRPGVAGAVGEEHPVRFQGQHLVDRCGRRHHVHLDAPLGHPVWRHRLDAEVDRHHPEAGLAGGGDDVGLPGGDLVGQEGAGHLRLGPDPFQQGGRVGLDAGHADPHRPALAQVTGDGPSVHLAHADHVLGLQLLVEGTTGPPARRDAGGVADHVAGHPDPARLVVLVIPAGVADVRRGGHHDLAVVAGIGECLLVARHPGGEHRLAEGLAHRSERPAAERAAVLQNEQSGWAGRGRD